MKYAKSIVATVMGLVAPLAALFAANGTLTSADIKAALVTAVVSGGSVWGVKNAGTTVAGLVVKVTADLDTFKAALDVALSQSLVIEPQPVSKSVIVNDAVHDPSVSVDAAGHPRLDFADGKAMYWDEAAQSFKMNGPSPTPPVVAPAPVDPTPPAV